MLEKIDIENVPFPKRTNANGEFAKQAVKDFAELNCDAVKITGWPVRRDVKSYLSAVRNQINRRSLTHAMRAIADDNYVYLYRVR